MNVTQARNEKSRETRSAILSVVLVGIWLAIIVGFALLSNRQSAPLLHAGGETLAALAAGFAAMAILRHAYKTRQGYLLLLGIGFLGAGLLDGIHALKAGEFSSLGITAGLPTHIFSSWLASRTYLAIGLVLGLLWWRYENSAKPPGKRLTGAVCTGFFGLLPACAWFFYSAQSPTDTLSGPLGITLAEAGLLVAFMLASVGYLFISSSRSNPFTLGLVLALVTALVSQLLYSIAPVDGMGADFVAAQILKILSYILVALGALIDWRRTMAFQIQDSLIRLNAIVDTAVDGIITMDGRSIIESANPAAERIFGYAAGSLPGQSIKVLLPESDRSKHDDNLARYLQSGEFWKANSIGISSQLDGLRSDGTRFPMELAVSDISVGRTRRFSGLVRDISERRAVEQSLEDLSSHLSMALNAGGMGSWDWDLVRGVMNKADARTYELYGYSALTDTGPEAFGNWGELLHPDDKSAYYSAYEAAVAENSSYSIEFRIILADGRVRWLENHCTPIQDGAGKVVRMIGTSHDITDRIEAMNVLVTARETAELANAAKSDFLAIMSHEIRTPMNGVLGMLEVLGQTSLNRQQQSMTELISTSASSLLNIINDILDFSKIEAGKLDTIIAPLVVEDVAQDVCASLNRAAEVASVQLLFFVDPGIPQLVLGDATRLRQILINLVGNAVKFSGGLGRPGDVLLRAVVCEQSAENLWLEFQVRDNGIGMNEQTLSLLFSPFAQADKPTNRIYGGTGLGLSISKRLAELMGGDISVSSEFGHGSTFTVRLPFRSSPVDAVTQASGPDLSGLLCLFVGEAAGVTDDFTVYLEHAGLDVERSADLHHAGRRLAAAGSSPDLLVVDTGVTRLSGTELRAALHLDSKSVSGEHFPILVIGRGLRHQLRRQDGLIMIDGNALSRRDFLSAVAVAVGQEELIEDSRAQADGPGLSNLEQPSREEALRHGRLILVAEDNKINQTVILHQLALLGYAADVAGDGATALGMLKNGDYALLLSDLHMPEMDGYELIKAIRETDFPGQHLPVIALTANALVGEAERCLAAGMSDFLSKPASLAQLQATLNKWLSGDPLDIEATKTPSRSRDFRGRKPMDIGVLRALVGNDEQVVEELLAEFCSSANEIVADLQAACRAGSGAAASAAAHKLKSSARSVGALGLGDLCEAMEVAGKALQISTLVAILPRLEVELAAVESYLESRV